MQFEVRFPEAEVARHLMIGSIKIRRVCYIEKEPYVIELKFVSSSLITGLMKEILDSSIYLYIQEELGYTITSSRKMIRTDKPNQ